MTIITGVSALHEKKKEEEAGVASAGFSHEGVKSGLTAATVALSGSVVITTKQIGTTPRTPLLCRCITQLPSTM